MNSNSHIEHVSNTILAGKLNLLKVLQQDFQDIHWLPQGFCEVFELIMHLALTNIRHKFQLVCLFYLIACQWQGWSVRYWAFPTVFGNENFKAELQQEKNICTTCGDTECY